MSFRLKTIIGIAFIESLLLVILIASGLQWMRNANELELINHSQGIAQLFAASTKNAVLTSDIATLETFVDDLLRTPDVAYVRIKSQEGILAEGGDLNSTTHSTVIDTRINDDDLIFDTAATIEESGHIFGRIELGVSTNKFHSALESAKRKAPLIAVIGLLLSGLFSYLLGTYLTRQLSSLRHAAEDISNGKIGIQIPVKSTDELGQTASAFNHMSSELRRSYQALNQSLATSREISEALHSSESHTRAILDNVIDAIISADEMGVIQTINLATTKIFGYKREELEGHNIKKIMTHQLSIVHDQYIQSYLQRQNKSSAFLGSNTERTAQRKDGSTFPIELVVVPYQQEDSYAFVAVIRDISDRKKVEQDLRESEEKNRLLLESAGEGIYGLDLEGKTTFVNPAVCEMLGYAPEELINHPMHNLIHHSYADGTPYPKDKCPMYAAFNDGQTKRVSDEVLWRKDGSHFPVEYTATPVKRNNDIVGAVVVLSDISEQKAIMDDLIQAKLDAETANKAKSEFLANMSHEIRTPMNGVLGMLSLLKTTQLDAKQQHYIKTAHSSADLLLNIINDILDFSKVEAGKLELEKIDFNFYKLVDDICQLLADQAINKNLDYAYYIDPSLPQYVKGDPTRVGQILLNLGGNAIKFTHKGNIHVRINVNRVVDSHYHLICEVADTGIGIAPDKQKTLFDAFQQADGSTTRRFGGSGLGLTISKQLLELMGGSISVNSEEGKGSTFSFILIFEKSSACDFENAGEEPFCAVDNQEQLHYIEDHTNTTNPMLTGKILLVEDNEVNQEIAAEYLSQTGVHVDIAKDGLEALDYTRNTEYDLIFMDCQMPRMDGFETTSKIRTSEKQLARYTPIIALTANAMHGDKERCLSVGMDDYIAKPIVQSILIEKLKKWLSTEVRPQPHNLNQTSSTHTSASYQFQYKTIDQKKSQEIIDKMGKHLPRIVEKFELSGENLVSDMLEGLKTQNADKLATAAHTLKGSSGTLGALLLSEICKQLENQAKSQNLSNANQLVKDIKAIQDKTVQELRDMCRFIEKDSA